MAMMSWMRRTSRYFLVIVVVTFIGSLAYFGATQDRGASASVATVNGEEISAAAFQHAYRNAVEQYRQVFKERFSEELMRQLRLQDQVVDRLVVDRLMQQRAQAEGLRVTDEELSAEITRMPVFQADGRFSRDRYLQVLTRAQLTAPAFEQDLRADLLRRKLQALVADGARVSEAEVFQAWEIRRARVRVAYLLVSPEALVATVTVTDADLTEYLRTHAATFARPERRTVLTALLPPASVPAPPVSDAEVEAAYTERVREFEQPKRVRVAHILVRVPTVGGSAAEDAAKAKAEAVLKRVRDGADFAQVAREVSEDQGTAARGGEVGLVAAGEMVPQFEQAAFGLKVGEVTGPVRTPFGYHVVKALEVVPGSKKELKDVAGTLRASLATEAQLSLLRTRAQEVQQQLLRAPDFGTEARRLGLTVRESGPFTRTDAVEGTGRVAEATTAIFGLPSGGVSAPVKVPEGYAIFRLTALEPAQQPEDVKLDQVRAAVTQALRRQKAQEAAQAKAKQLVEAWRAGEDPRALAKRESVSFGETGTFSRAEPLTDQEIGQAVSGLALTLPEGQVGGPAAGAKGLYVVRVTGRERPDPKDFDKTRAELARELTEQKRSQIWQAWLAALRAGAKIDINRKVLPQT